MEIGGFSVSEEVKTSGRVARECPQLKMQLVNIDTTGCSGQEPSTTSVKREYSRATFPKAESIGREADNLYSSSAEWLKNFGSSYVHNHDAPSHTSSEQREVSGCYGPLRGDL